MGGEGELGFCVLWYGFILRCPIPRPHSSAQISSFVVHSKGNCPGSQDAHRPPSSSSSSHTVIFCHSIAQKPVKGQHWQRRIGVVLCFLILQVRGEVWNTRRPVANPGREGSTIKLFFRELLAERDPCTEEEFENVPYSTSVIYWMTRTLAQWKFKLLFRVLDQNSWFW